METGRKFEPSSEQQVEMLKRMLRIRSFEYKALAHCTERLNRGPLHLYVGEEGVAAGACAALEKGDYITSTHRGHGHCIAMGGDVKRMLAEIVGRATGYCKGKGGSMHIADLDLGIMGANGIVGAGIPIAIGAGIAMDNSGKDNIILCFFGDGASNTGAFHESLNMASIWQLPIVFLCENNLYGISGCVKETVNICDISDRAASYGITGVSIDGNDVFEVFDTVKKAREQCIAGNGPVLIEAKTYRWLGHWHADPCRYREEAEVETWKKKDPIKRLREHLVSNGIVDQKDAERIEREINEEIEATEKFAVESPFPDPEEALQDVYAERSES